MEKTIHTAIYRRIIADLRRIRTERKLTQKQVCDNMGKASTWISKIESCEIRLDVLGYLQLCKIYGLSARKHIARYELSD